METAERVLVGGLFCIGQVPSWKYLCGFSLEIGSLGNPIWVCR